MSTLTSKRSKKIKVLLHEQTANQIIELAVVLPILLVIVVGIFDFGQAFTLRQTLNNIAREAARLGSSQPTADLSQTDPDSVNAIRDLIDSDLITARLDDCGLGNTQSGGAIARQGALSRVKWLATGNRCPVGQIMVTIERGIPVANSLGINVISTHVNISYPFAWHFNKVIGLIAPGASGPSNPISGDAILPNMD